MAKQKGFIKIEGSIGDITFYKTQDGHLAKGKTTLNPLSVELRRSRLYVTKNGRETSSRHTITNLLSSPKKNYFTAH